MPQPEEDLGPRWLRDTTTIDADIRAMEDFAQTLFAELEQNYVHDRDAPAANRRTLRL